MNAATGILYLDILVRPFFKVAVKFPAIGFILLLALYGVIGYIALKSAFFEGGN